MRLFAVDDKDSIFVGILNIPIMEAAQSAIDTYALFL